MRHRKKTVKLGRTSAHRNELLSNLVCALIDNKRIKTTAPKAKAARCLADKMVTLGKKGQLAHRRQAISILKNEKSVKELFDVVAPVFTERKGGYTRIIKLGRRISDSSEMVLLEWSEAIIAPVAEEAAEEVAEATAE
ncbi:MAG: 50S ribosomal protein L17 [Pontiella sp.]